MPKKKVAVAISDWLLDELDSAASDASISRSAMVEEAVADYVVTPSVARRRASVSLGRMRSRWRTWRASPAECEQDAVAALEPSSLEKLRALRASGRGLDA